MPLNRRQAVIGLAASPLAPGMALGQDIAAPDPDDIGEVVWRLLSGRVLDRAAAVRALSNYEGRDIIPSLIFALRYTRSFETPVREALERLAGTSEPQGWFGWMLWQERHPEIIPHPSYIGLKRRVFLAIDRNFAPFLAPEHLTREAARIRVEEIAWGGVVKDGIPSLDSPPLIAATEADYLRDEDLVFGVSINGDARAYPLRIMGWHEMFNEVIGGVPLALAYCTLCGSGILFETEVEGRAAPFVFGSSGFLYRSNKLMFDRETHSLWNQFTGEPVVGPLAQSGIRLRQRPVVISPWADWRAANPDTQVLSLATGHRRDYGPGVVYRDYFASPDLMFPAEVSDTRLAAKDYVFGVRVFGAAKAWPLSAFAGGAVINDRIGDVDLVLVGDAGGRTVRAYESGGRAFAPGPGGGLVAGGQDWRMTEDALLAEDGTRAPRIAGHIAYWFAWQNYLGTKAELAAG